MTRATEWLLWSGALAGFVVASLTARAASPEPMLPRASAGIAADGMIAPAESLGARVARVVAGDPFRMARKPSGVPFGSTAAADIAPRAAAVLPELQLRGVLGPPWRAVLEVPGTELGQLVRAGDSIGHAHVVSVRQGAVTLRTPDTTWTLMMRRP